MLVVVLGSLLLTACSPAASAWQEQYDLGVRYLEKGNYEEAIIAFTAAIEIDPKQAPSYVGRGDAYIGSGKTEENLIAAQADYEKAIELGETDAEVYLKLADIYNTLGNTDAAIAILKQGYDATGDADIFDKLNQLQDDRPEGASEVVTVEGYIIFNPDEYQTEWYTYIELYENPNKNEYCSIDRDGVRFIQPVNVVLDGKNVSIQEAHLRYEDGLFGDEAQLGDFKIGGHGSLIKQPIRMTGYFYKNEQTTEINGPILDEELNETYYCYRPNGDYVFYVKEYEELS